MAHWFDSLEGTLEMAWAELLRATQDRKSPFRLPVLATVSADGAPKARTVVLRSAKRPASLVFHTDARSAKVHEITHEPRVALTFWHPKRSLQLRVEGIAAPLSASEQREAYNALHPGAQRVYHTEPAPGTPLPEREHMVHTDTVQSFLAFGVEIATLETLHLGKASHSRARFQGADAKWLAP
ncbi:MAG: pyridoxamine 5'-phosphate oxidase family protein [Pseudomonadota bacterium]